MLTEPVIVTMQVVETLEELEVPYLSGGSLASAMHGVVRAWAGRLGVLDLLVRAFDQARGSAA